MTNSSFDAPSNPLFQILGWKTIEELIAEEAKMMVFKSVNDFGPHYMQKMFTRNPHFSERLLRNTANDLKLSLRKSIVGQNRFSYLGARVWNVLSTECKESRSLEVFKSFLN